MELCTITPEMSEKFLSKNTSNRKITEKNVANIMRALSNNEWSLNGETIKFDFNGNVLDGQHRLLACVRSGIPFRSYIVRNLAPETFTTIDIGAKRTAADILSIHKVPNANNLAAIIKCYVEAKHNRNFSLGNISATNEQILNEYKSSPELYQKLALSYAGISKFVTSPFMAICKSAIEIYGERWFEESIEKIKTGQNLKYGDPCLAIREWSINNKGNSNTRTNTRAIYVKAIKGMATNAKIKKLRFVKEDSFPALS